MSGSEPDPNKDLEEDVVETQGTLRYKQAANTQDADDDDDFDDYYDEIVSESETVVTVTKTETAAGAASDIAGSESSEVEEDYWEEQQRYESADGTRVIRHNLKTKQKKVDDENEETKQAGGTIRNKLGRSVEEKPRTNVVVKLLEKNPLGMTLPEMAGGVRKQKRIKTLRPMLAQAIKEGQIMPVSQRAGHTVYKLVKNIGPR
ncbi:hypothetical protein KF707_11255 [Candidatus Obscuribacterales bacterium]|nr:hypothetical protein [Candidatus Obscuribacterales bacterium]MBX3136805.1 hypothetical protein [Candidatus Obscuribacterales bacterium]MBX3150520.1 hypothetical protein [Candidatus Obscuribacterales bacterium]